MIIYCDEHGYAHNFSAPRSPQQNGIIERKNITFQVMARTMLNESKLPDIFLREVVYTTVHILNRGQLKVKGDKTPYHPWKGRPTTIKHFKYLGVSVIF